MNLDIYDPPIMRDGVKIYRLHRSHRQRMILGLGFIIVLSLIFLFAISLNVRSQLELVPFCLLFGVFVLYVAYLVYQAFVFRLRLNSKGGALYGPGKTIHFDWFDVTTVEYDNWYDKNLNLNQLCLKIETYEVSHHFWLPSLYFFPVAVLDNLIPLSRVQHRKPFDSLNTKIEPPNYFEYRNHLEEFLKSPLGQDIVQFAPHAFKNVLKDYLPKYDI